MMQNSLIVFETERLFIKKFQKIDFRNFLRLHQNPTIMRYFDGGIKTLEQSKKRFAEVMQHQEKYGFGYYNLFLKNNAEYIGQAGLYYNYDMSVNLCYALLNEYISKGYALEAVSKILDNAFSVMKFTQITAMSTPQNYRSRLLLKKLGATFIEDKILSSGIKVLFYIIKKDNFYKSREYIKNKYKYRKSIGAILTNQHGFVYLFRRSDFPDAWQAPEGGVDNNENILDAVYREIEEEVGIKKNNLKLLAETQGFIKYNYLDNRIKYGCIGQEKKFYLFNFLGEVEDFSYNSTMEAQEFTECRLMSKVNVPDFVPTFKKELYQRVVEEFDPFLK